MSEGSYDYVKQDVMEQLNFISSLGTHLFIYPFVGRSKSVVARFGFINFLVLLTATQLLFTIFSKDLKDWVEVVNVVPNLAVVLMTTLKYIKVHTNKTVYKKIFDHFRDDLWDVVSDCKKHKEIVVRYMFVTKYVTRFMFYFSMGLTIAVNCIPRIIMYFEKHATGEVSECLYPFDGWYPFDKVKWFYAVYIWEGLMTCVVVGIYAYASVNNTSFTLFICLELKILGNSIENLITPEDIASISKHLADNRRDEKTHHKIKKRLRGILRRHQFLAE